MNPYCFEGVCDLCGGTGAMTPQMVVSAWHGAMLVHSNPRRCKEELQKKATAQEHT